VSRERNVNGFHADHAEKAKATLGLADGESYLGIAAKASGPFDDDHPEEETLRAGGSCRSGGRAA
jgi:hypothetical protein